jgi:thiamine biosynthesis lipoprotein
MIKKVAAIFLIFSVLLVLCSCDKSIEYTTVSFTSMDTFITLTAEKENLSAIKSAKKKIEKLSEKLDRKIKKSAIYSINKSGKGRDIGNICALSQKYAEQTNGAFNPCLGKVIDLWNIGKDNFKIPSEKKIASAMQKSSYTALSVENSSVSLTRGAVIDLGGIAKGYAADIAVESLKASGVKSAMLSLGGNVALIGKKDGKQNFQVAIADPSGSEKAACTLGLSDCFAVTSGDYQRYSEVDGKRYCHIFNCYGRPVDNSLASVTVICDNGAKADAYSTALFVMGLKGAKRFYNNVGGFEAVYITHDKRIILTPGLVDKFNVNTEEYTYEIQKR